ncbi:hypothetical protein AB0K92_32955 [Streptomyces sp. NPDC052687]|uniref:hypothetical protein n=1 Tax=Streptomyces sp. NPDC052687 TaxID=3154759 RepID=UPI0034314693
MIVWLNGTHGVGKTTTSALVQQLVPDSRVFDAEKVGETLMDIKPGPPATDNFQAARTWLHAEAEVVDTTHLTPAQAAQQITEALSADKTVSLGSFGSFHGTDGTADPGGAKH